MDFFVEKGYMIELFVLFVFIDDDLLLWINFGVVILKKYFDGCEIFKKLRIVNF